MNAESAKVSQRAQKKAKKIQKEDLKVQMQRNRFTKAIFLIFVFFTLIFCALCETFAPSAFKNSSKPLENQPLIHKYKTINFFRNPQE